MLFDYDGDRFHVVVIHQWRGGLVERETSYYAAPFQAPAWRGEVGRAGSKFPLDLTTDRPRGAAARTSEAIRPACGAQGAGR